MTTLKRIAELAGVTEGTVSKVLNGRYKENRPSSKAKSERIRQIAREQNYRPNAAGRAIARGKFDCFAILQDPDKGRSFLPMDLLEGIHDALAAEGKHLTFARVTDGQVTDASKLPKIMQRTMTDGLLVNINSLLPSRMVELVEEFCLPAIFMNTDLDKDCIGPDDQGAGRQVTEALLDMGCRNILYADLGWHMSSGHISRQKRHDGYCQAMTSAGLAAWEFMPSIDPTPDNRRSSAAEWLTQHPTPDAIVGYSDPLDVMPFVFADSARLEQVKLASFIGAITESFLTVEAVLPNYEMGVQAAKMIMAKVEDPDKHFPLREIPFTIRTH